MTDGEALAEARRRWGERAEVAFDEGTCVALCLVGVRGVDDRHDWIGVGRTWELAFAAAELEERRRRERS